VRRLPIRVKLTAWYFAVLAVTFALSGAIAFLAMRKSIEKTVDEGLRGRALSIQEFIEREEPSEPEGLEHGLREHFELSAEGDLAQVSDQQGRWIYRSQLMKRYGVPLPQSTSPVIQNRRAGGLPLRVLVTEAHLNTGHYRILVAAPMDDFNKALARFKWVLLLSGPLLLLFASAGGYWMSRRALSPVDEITRAARNISSTNLSSRLVVPESRDELQDLSETLNGMLARLEAAFRRITQFTADASHELRTPVALMRTTAELALRKPRGEAEYRDALTQILKELETTSLLIENLMLLARADSGVEAQQFAPVDLAGTLRETCCHGRTLAAPKKIDFTEQIGNGPVLVQGDRHGLRRLFLILIDNAVKYTPPDGKVTVSLFSADGFAVIEVRDTGIGISEADLPHIFERFYRADKVRSRETGGAGLGLSIGRWIAQSHGGKIGVESTPSHGSVFRVRLPLATQVAPSS
jgi:two-component system, OmpR family, heavy metal sensor histidine kinase CusS